MSEQELQSEYEHGYSVGKYHGFKEGEKVGYQKALAEVWGEVQRFGELIETMDQIVEKLNRLNQQEGDARGGQTDDQG